MEREVLKRKKTDRKNSEKLWSCFVEETRLMKIDDDNENNYLKKKIVWKILKKLPQFEFYKLYERKNKNSYFDIFEI